MVYCFRCKTCGERWDNGSGQHGLHPTNGCERPVVVRDYKAESVGIGEGVRASRDQGVQEARVFHQWAEEAGG